MQIDTYIAKVGQTDDDIENVFFLTVDPLIGHSYNY